MSWRLAVSWAVLAALALAASAVPVRAQLTQNPDVTTQGTQFVGQPEQPAAPQVAPVAPPPTPAPPVVAPPAVAAPQPPPAPAGLPPRYPSVVILLDTSDSMLDKTPGKSLSHLDEAKNALAQVILGMSAQTRVQVWSFNTRMIGVPVNGAPPGTFTPVGNRAQRDELVRNIRALQTGGGTNLYQSMLKVLSFFDDPQDLPLYRSGERWPVLVVVSDGEDSGVTPVTLEQVLAAKAEHPLVTINSIGFTVSKQDVWLKTLCQLATRPEGCATADDQAQLRAMLESFYQPSLAQK